MKTTNPLLDKLNQDCHFGYNKVYVYTTNKSYLCFESDTLDQPKEFLTHGYDKIELLDELHLVTTQDKKQEIQRFSIQERNERASYIVKKEISLRNITGYTIQNPIGKSYTGSNSKTLILKNQEGFYTYLDYNINSRFYMLNLVPEVLEEAHPFDEDFIGYAKVSFKDNLNNKKEGYICRDDFMARSINEIKLYSSSDIKEKSLLKTPVKRF